MAKSNWEVHVTVESTCVVRVSAENEQAAIEAASNYALEALEPDTPHYADWRQAEAFKEG